MVRWVLTRAEGGGRVQEAAGQVQAVAGTQHGLDQRRLLGSPLDRGLAIGPGLIAQRGLVHGRVDLPALLALDLQHEDVVHVVVIAEALVLRGRDVGIGLHRVTELGGQLLAQRDDRRPDAVQSLQHHRRPVGEQPDELVVADLVGDAGADAAGSGEGLVGQRVAALGHPQERGPQPALGDQFVDRIAAQQIGEGARQVVRRGEQRLLPPVVRRELVAIDGDEPRQHGVPGASGHSVPCRVEMSQLEVQRALERAAVGPTVGPAVGAPVRNAGHALGAAVGWALGAAVGTAVRTAVGTAVGDVGAAIGAAVRATVGATVGAAIGTAVGGSRTPSAPPSAGLRAAVSAAVGAAVRAAVLDARNAVCAAVGGTFEIRDTFAAVLR